MVIATITKGGTLPDSAAKTDFYTLIDSASISISSIENADISASAAIADSKLAQITTASKVSGAALTGLASVPAGAGVIPAANLTPAASAAEVLTGSEAAKYIAPSTMVNHKGCVKAWVSFDGTGTVDTTPDYNYNVSGLTDNGTGDYTIAWGTDFGSVNYVAVGLAYVASHQLRIVTNGANAPAAGTFRFLCVDAAPTAFDPSWVSVMAIGAQ